MNTSDSQGPGLSSLIVQPPSLKRAFHHQPPLSPAKPSTTFRCGLFSSQNDSDTNLSALLDSRGDYSIEGAEDIESADGDEASSNASTLWSTHSTDFQLSRRVGVAPLHPCRTSRSISDRGSPLRKEKVHTPKNAADPNIIWSPILDEQQHTGIVPPTTPGGTSLQLDSPRLALYKHQLQGTVTPQVGCVVCSSGDISQPPPGKERKVSLATSLGGGSGSSSDLILDAVEHSTTPKSSMDSRGPTNTLMPGASVTRRHTTIHVYSSAPVPARVAVEDI